MNHDLSPLLVAIAEHAPCGEDYSFSNEFHSIKKARTQDDLLLDQGDWITEHKQADWDMVATSCMDLLCNKSKDIRLLTWLSEAWANLYGFEGIAKGLELSHRLLEQYWLHLHPEIEDDDLDQRIGLLQGLINQLPSLIKKVPLTQHAPFYNLLDYENCLYQENIRRKQGYEDEFSKPVVDLEQFEQSCNHGNATFKFQNYQYFQEILQQWTQLKQILDDVLGLESPSFATIDASLEHLHQHLKKLYKTETLQSNLSSSVATVESTSLNVTEQGMLQMPNNSQQPQFQPQIQSHVENREQAMRVLQEIAAYFQENEPHSPVSYMLQKTIKWSQMPLHEWLTQVIKDDQPLQMVQEMLGVQPKNEYE